MYSYPVKNDEHAIARHSCGADARSGASASGREEAADGLFDRDRDLRGQRLARDLGSLSIRFEEVHAVRALGQMPTETNLFVGGQLVVVAAVALAGTYLASYAGGLIALRQRALSIRQAAPALQDVEHAPDATLLLLYPNAAYLREQAHALRDLQVGPYARLK